MGLLPTSRQGGECSWCWPSSETLYYTNHVDFLSSVTRARILFVKETRVTAIRKDSSAESIWSETKQELVWKSF